MEKSGQDILGVVFTRSFVWRRSESELIERSDHYIQSMVVFPALSKPRISMRTSFFENNLPKIEEKSTPIVSENLGTNFLRRDASSSLQKGIVE
jgi:hypothetical protein